MDKITVQEQDLFQYLISGTEGLALVKTEFDGVETAVICSVNNAEGEQVDLQPLAILVNDELFSKLKPPAKDVDVVETQSTDVSMDDLPKLKKLYSKAVEQGKEQFEFKFKPIVTSYAKYLIEYMESRNSK